MKDITLLLLILLFALLSQATAPQLINYQGVARNNAGAELVSQNITLRITIRKNTTGGAIVYQETHNTTTTALGLFTIQIGGGVAGSGNFSGIAWQDGTYFVQTEMDPAGGNSFVNLGAVQLVSVPYALHSQKADTAGRLSNPPDLSISNDSLQLTNTPGATKIGLKKYLDDKTVTITPGLGIAVKGTYPDFTVKDSIPNPLFPVPMAFNGGVIYVHPTDNAVNIPWSNNPNNGAGAYDLFDGRANTLAAVNQPGSTQSAAKVCYDLVAYGYDDWYLPAVYELSAMQLQSYYLKQPTILPHYIYWSSTEYTVLGAYRGLLFGVSWSYDIKSNLASVRCIRRD